METLLMSEPILVVDDSATTRRFIARTLTLSGVGPEQILEADSGEKALSLLREKKASLVLADLNMPGMGGHAMIETMQHEPELCTIPVVVISSEGNETVIDSLITLGVRWVLRKPFQPGMLRDVLHQCLEQR
jgi:two-component system chemotaxis response regulator CheY